MAECLPLVLLHGWGAHARIWGDVATKLGCDGLVSAPDLPGYGQASLVGAYTVEAVAASLAKRVGEACVLCGWSMGGLIAQAWAVERPDQVRGLVLVSSTPCYTQRADWPHGIPDAELAKFAAGVAGDRSAALARFQGLQAKQDAMKREVLSALRRETEISGVPRLETLLMGLELLRVTDLRAAVPRIKCPTLVVHGAYDSICPPGAGQWLADTLPQGQMQLHPGAAHAPFLSDLPWFLDRVRQFLRGIDVL